MLFKFQACISRFNLKHIIIWKPKINFDIKRKAHIMKRLSKLITEIEKKIRNKRKLQKHANIAGKMHKTTSKRKLKSRNKFLYELRK